MTWLILASFAYLTVASAVGRVKYHHGKKNCRWSPRNCDAGDGHWLAAGLLALAWPILILLMPGAWVGGLYINCDERVERRVQREKVRHDQKMEEIRAEQERDKQAIEFLERSVVHTGFTDGLLKERG